LSAGPPRVYLDSNVFVTAFENAGARSDHAWWIMLAIENGDIVGATSELTLAEILVKPVEMGAAEIAAAYEQVIAPGPNFEVMPVRREILVEAAGIRARRSSIRLPDAVHVATALALSCRFFVTDDLRLALPEDIKLVPVNPFTLDEILGKPL
jgi:predicted nucleic acid-binding protein